MAALLALVLVQACAPEPPELSVYKTLVSDKRFRRQIGITPEEWKPPDCSVERFVNMDGIRFGLPAGVPHDAEIRLYEAGILVKWSDVTLFVGRLHSLEEVLDHVGWEYSTLLLGLPEEWEPQVQGARERLAADRIVWLREVYGSLPVVEAAAAKMSSDQVAELTLRLRLKGSVPKGTVAIRDVAMDGRHGFIFGIDDNEPKSHLELVVRDGGDELVSQAVIEGGNERLHDELVGCIMTTLRRVAPE